MSALFTLVQQKLI